MYYLVRSVTDRYRGYHAVINESFTLFRIDNIVGGGVLFLVSQFISGDHHCFGHRADRMVMAGRGGHPAGSVLVDPTRRYPDAITAGSAGLNSDPPRLPVSVVAGVLLRRDLYPG